MIKIIIITIIFAFLIVYLKSTKSEYADLALVGSSIILIFISIDYVSSTLEVINKIVELSNLNKEYYKIILKIISIAYVVEFGSSTIEDMGLKSLSNKIVFLGKIIIIAVSAPIIYAVFNVINQLIIWRKKLYAYF